MTNKFFNLFHRLKKSDFWKNLISLIPSKLGGLFFSRFLLDGVCNTKQNVFWTDSFTLKKTPTYKPSSKIKALIYKAFLLFFSPG